MIKAGVASSVLHGNLKYEEYRGLQVAYMLNIRRGGLLILNDDFHFLSDALFASLYHMRAEM